MTALKRITTRGKRAARRVAEKAEAKLMAAVGRRAVRTKTRAVGKVGRSAAKAGLIAGGVAAAAVVVRAVRRRRRSV